MPCVGGHHGICLVDDREPAPRRQLGHAPVVVRDRHRDIRRRASRSGVDLLVETRQREDGRCAVAARNVDEAMNHELRPREIRVAPLPEHPAATAVAERADLHGVVGIRRRHPRRAVPATVMIIDSDRTTADSAVGR